MRAPNRSHRTSLELIEQWWREPVEYVGYVQYFADRGLGKPIRFAIGAAAGFIAAFALVGLIPAASSTPSMAATAGFAAGCVFWAAVWWTRRTWPSCRWSRAFIASADLGIASIALVGSNWLIGLFAFHCFALVSVYLVFFDGPKALVGHNVVVIATVVIFISLERAYGRIDDGTFAGIIFGAIVPVATATVALQIGIQTLRNDANRSTTDPLTALLNRRGLYLHFHALLGRKESAAEVVAVVVVDLDRFKAINDTYGHTVGDEVLIRCARRIRAGIGNGPLVARTGGEEFVIVAVTDRENGRHLAQKIRSAIVDTDERPAITASIGMHAVARLRFTDPDADPIHLLDAAIADADQSMFRVKRQGGDAIAST